MKITIKNILLASIALFSSIVYSNQNTYELFIEPVSDSIKTGAQSSSADDTIRTYNPTVRSVEKDSIVSLKINDAVHQFVVSRINKKGDTRLSFSGFSQNKGDFLHLADHNGQVVGSLMTTGKL